MKVQTILYVEDDLVTLTTYGKALHEAGFKVDTACDGIAALKYLREHEPDVILLDLMLPKLDGEEVLKFIYRNPQLSGIPVVILSTNTVISLANEPLIERAEGHLLKENCNVQRLLETLNRVLEAEKLDEPPIPDAAPLDPSRFKPAEMQRHLRVDLKPTLPTPPGWIHPDPPADRA